MHIGNELLTPGTGLTLIGVAGAGLSFAAWRARKVLDERKVPLMGVMGAFVFAGQMINFPIMVGTSGHLINIDKNVNGNNEYGYKRKRIGWIFVFEWQQHVLLYPESFTTKTQRTQRYKSNKKPSF